MVCVLVLTESPVAHPCEGVPCKQRFPRWDSVCVSGRGPCGQWTQGASEAQRRIDGRARGGWRAPHPFRALDLISRAASLAARGVAAAVALRRPQHEARLRRTPWPQLWPSCSSPSPPSTVRPDFLWKFQNKRFARLNTAIIHTRRGQIHANNNPICSHRYVIRKLKFAY